ncbi:DUF4381 domain-containing protein [Aliidiomarina halalkaliphila]|uniref:DUF4381 domain-containing protein n=1 Tax=Aliidiomarina halalkaliphila TaxID=2593535 RepID=A0A552X3A2_9GAMM|nr:DUF4381 domain-containing protein [Aliidiomarina halalkaliphila]TRW49369.1 DUF4381 domain-containing protein [Aliidiomarina halalkaliphila]
MNPLDQLHDIVAAGDVGWWPLAWGWWVLICLCVVGLCLIIRSCFRAYARARPRRLVLAELQRPHESLSAINSTVKRGLRMAQVPLEINQLHGKDWIDFLVNTGPNGNSNNFQTQLRAFSDRLYQSNNEESVRRYQALMQQWAAQTRWLYKGGADV